MTGIAGGGYAVSGRGRERRAREVLDFFVDRPGLGRRRGTPELEELAVPFGEELVHYFVGAATCAVPGVPAGPRRALAPGGTLPWERLVEPALRLARAGVGMPPAHAKCLAMLAPVMTMREGGRIYSPGGRLLEAGDRLDQPGLVRALEVVAAEGARTLLRGDARRVAARPDGGARRPRHAGGPRRATASSGPRLPRSTYAGVRVADARRALAARRHARRPSPPERRVAGRPRARRSPALLAAPLYSGRTYEHTTNLCVVDAAGSACVDHDQPRARLGRLPPGLRRPPEQHARRVRPPRRPARSRQADGEHDVADRRARRRRARLAAGAAGGTRLRPALAQVLSGILDEGLAPQAAVDRPRLHSTGAIVHLEPGFEDERRRGARGRRATTCASGTSSTTTSAAVSVVARGGGAADPRRSGLALGSGPS